MENEEFEAALDRYGGALAAWPSAEREAARVLLTRSRVAREAHAAMELVECLLARTAIRPEARPDDLVARATRRKQDNAVRAREPLAWRLRAGGLLLVLCAGFAVGAVADAPSPALDDGLALAFGPADPFDEL